MNEPRVKHDFFLEINGEDHICEIYDTEDTHVIDYGIYPLLEDGSKGEPIEEPSEELEQEVQEHYYDHITTCWDDNVI